MAKPLCNADMLKLVYAQDPATWGARIPDPSKMKWEEMNTLINATNFKQGRNEIFEELVNRIGLTRFIQMQADNPLAMFKRGSMRFGDTVQEISTDIVTATEFGGVKSPDIDQFIPKLSDVQAAYFKKNRKQYYKITVGDDRLERAFINERGLQALISGILSSLDRSNEVDEFIFAKQALSSYYKNDQYPLLDTQQVLVPDVTSDTVKREDIVKYIEIIKKTSKKMTFNSRFFNPVKMMNISRPSDLILISRYQAGIVNEVQNLSVIFNEQFNELKVPIIDVDDFGVDDKGNEILPNVTSILCDRRLVEILLIHNEVTTAYNAQNLYRNYFFHIEQLYKTSPFHNCIFFVTNKTKAC